MIVQGCILVSLTMVALKIDGYQSWSWKNAFWWYWVVLSLSIGFEITLILILFGKYITRLQQQIANKYTIVRN